MPHFRKTNPYRLGPRELTVLKHYAQGISPGEIARLMYISPKTVSTYRQRIFDRLDVKNVMQAVLKAHQLGLVELLGVSIKPRCLACGKDL